MKQRMLITATVYDKRNNVLAKATNSYTKTHPKQASLAARAGLPEKQFLHAEIAALLECARRRKQPYKITVERYNRKGEPVDAKPCKICMPFIKACGVKIIEYTIG